MLKTALLSLYAMHGYDLPSEQQRGNGKKGDPTVVPEMGDEICTAAPFPISRALYYPRELGKRNCLSSGSSDEKWAGMTILAGKVFAAGAEFFHFSAMQNVKPSVDCISDCGLLFRSFSVAKKRNLRQIEHAEIGKRT